jgi:hypothetical protein
LRVAVFTFAPVAASFTAVMCRAVLGAVESSPLHEAPVGAPGWAGSPARLNVAEVTLAV